VAILGGGGVGFEVAEFLSDAHSPGSQDIDAYCREWGVDRDGSTPGFLSAVTPQVPRADRVVYLLQRKGSKMGKNLGRTTGWIRHARLVNRGVQMIPGVRVQGIDQRGLVLTIGQRKRVLEVDDVVVCIGQVPVSELADELRAAGLRPQVIGGARDATALSAERAIREGVDLGGAL
jgi:2,4-dienoyl-CoA reductase (NADPH2)